MATVLITGGTGMIGKAVTKALLEKNYEVIILTRKLPVINPASRISYALWNIEKQTIDEKAIRQADHIIHLAGANIGEKRWTKKRKKEIIDSRIKSSDLLVKSLKEIPDKIKTVIAASAIGWYGPDLTEKKTAFIETDSPANDFLGELCRQWEESIEPVQQMNKRLVKFRIGVVISKEGGAMKEFRRPLRFGIAPILGNGKQIMSWIHIDDIVQLYISAIENENMHGIYNAVAPYPVSNKEFVVQLAKARNRFYIPVYVPSFLLKLILGDMSREVLKSATISSAKTEQAEFVFKYPDMQSLRNYFTS